MQEVNSSQIGLLIATGPTLNDVPLEFLQKYRSYSANGIFLLEGFIPHHYFCSDSYFLEQNFEEIRKLAPKTDMWLRWPYHAKLGYNARPMHRIPDSWSFEPDMVLGLSGTVLYQALQVAYWHGIQTLLVVGLDHDYFDNSEQAFPNHFIKDYVKNPEKHPQNVFATGNAEYSKMLKKMVEDGFAMANQVFQADGRKIINLTPGSKYHGFTNGKLEEWL